MMFYLLFLMLLACSENNGENGNEDPLWFEAGLYSSSLAYIEGEGTRAVRLTLELSETGSISDYELVSLAETFRTKKGECLIGEAITPDENTWEAFCDGLEDVEVFSDGFSINVSWFDEKIHKATFE